MSPPVPDRTQTLAPRADSAPPATPVERADVTSPTIAADDPERYEQLREHARGGLGRVVRAVDKRLGRTVAVKELLRRGHSAGDEARFLREALITARLEHPGIVPVHEAGRWPNGDPYYVMKLVEGSTLKELLAGQHTLRDRLHLLPHVIAIADAVGYAHNQGVIHRDLKPSNVIVGEFGETIVIDWGLARDRRDHVPELSEEMLLAAGSGSTTISGKVVGTPSYMSPEQARGELVDERADVYAIGAVLYELLAGVPPHNDDTPQATLERVIAGPPMPLPSAAPHVPSELATIVSKAMARCPEDRYPNASALAEDLRRFQTGKLVSAHSYTAWSLVRKKLSQHRGVVAVAAASALALAGIGVGSFRRVVAERNNAQVYGAQAEEARAQLERRQHDLVLTQAVTSLRKDPTATLAWLKTAEIGDHERAHVQDVIDEAIALGVAKHVFRPGAWVFDAAFTPDGTRVVATVQDRSVRLYELETGTERVLGRVASPADTLVMARDGSFVVTGSQQGDITLWPLDGGPQKLASTGRNVKALHLAPDGASVLVLREVGEPQLVALDGSGVKPLFPPTAQRTAVATADWTRRVTTTSPNQIAAVTPAGLRPLAQAPKLITRLFMSPRGDTVLVHDNAAIWRVDYTGGELEKVTDYEGKLVDAVWSPDERYVAFSGDLHEILIYDLTQRELRELRGHADAIYTVQWSRDGRRLLSAGDDGTARVWTVADGTALVLRGHDDDVYRARFSSDERQVTTSSLDGSVRVWAIEQPGARVLVEGKPIEQLSVEGELALVTTAGELSRWNLASGHREPLFSWAAEKNGLGVGVPSPDGERLLVPAADWSIEVRRRAGPSITLRGHKKGITRIEFSRDGKFLYTASLDGTLRLWDLGTGASRLLVDGDVPVRAFAVAADGRVAAHIGETGRMIWPDGKTADLGPMCIAFGEFEKVRDRLILRRCDSGLAIYEGDKAIELPTGMSHVSRIAVSADGLRIAGAMGDRTVRLWDAQTGRVLRILRGHSDLVNDVAFSPDGTTLASASHDKTVRVWDLASERHRVLRGHQLSVHRLAWRGGKQLVTSSRDGTLRVWDLPVLDLPTVHDLAGQLARATSARIDGDRPTSGEHGRGT